MGRTPTQQRQYNPKQQQHRAHHSNRTESRPDDHSSRIFPVRSNPFHRRKRRRSRAWWRRWRELHAFLQTVDADPLVASHKQLEQNVASRDVEAILVVDADLAQHGPAVRTIPHRG